MYVSERYRIHGKDAQTIALGIEELVRTGALPAGEPLPTVRGLAGELAVSPTTVAAAYRTLRDRGLVQGEGRRGTRVTGARSDRARTAPAVPAGIRDLSSGAPDPALLPRYGPFLRRLTSAPRLYERSSVLPALEEVLRLDIAADFGRAVADPLAIVSGALDGIERTLLSVLRPGDRVAVEDPGYANLIDLVAAAGLLAVPVIIDADGMTPESLHRAVRAGVRAVVITPRAQNPTGASTSAGRRRDLRALLREHPGVLVVEDDHAAGIAGAPLHAVGPGLERWVYVRSLSKAHGPDLRVAALLGDPETVAHVTRRHRLGAGWVPLLMQELAAGLLADPAVADRVRAAQAAYAARRDALLRALDVRGIAATGRTGLNVWVPVANESAAVTALRDAGWAVGAGERFRLRSAPALRITVATLAPDEAQRVAAAVDAGQRQGTYAG